MKVQAQIGMVLNLDKCIGCHTCSVGCKHVWTSREGIEYAWFNNVETKPGLGYPKMWESQKIWNGGWELNDSEILVPKIGGKWKILLSLFANPNLPVIDDYYEPYTFDYSYLQNAPILKTPPVARPISTITGKIIDIKGSANWEEILGGEFFIRGKDSNFHNVEKKILHEFENTFMMYLPRLCEHCLNPACVAVCPSGAIYKRQEDGIVLVDQNKCRGWRMCISGCPYKKVYYNWKTGKSEKCLFCYPRIESGLPTICAETCVGRIRYLGVILYDADKILSAASTKNKLDLYEKQLDIFLDPNDENVIKAARKNNIPENWIYYAKKSPIYKMAVKWKIALPLHPEYRTLPMVWYIPPLSPIKNGIKNITDKSDIFYNIESLRIPIKYLANMLTAGCEKIVFNALKKMLIMRIYMRNKIINKNVDCSILKNNDIDILEIEEIYKYLAIANYEDRFVLPTTNKNYNENSDIFALRSGAGFSNDITNFKLQNISGINKRKNLFGGL